MNRRYLVALLGLALLAGVVLWSLGDVEEGGGDLPEATGGEFGASAAPVEVTRGVPPAPISGRPFEPGPQPGAGKGLTVLVLDEEQRPVGGARIEVSGEDASIVFPPTDAEGISRAERYPRRMIVLRATAGERSGSSWWQPGPVLRREVRIFVRPTKVVRVVVRDAEGAPVSGISVGLGDAEGRPHQGIEKRETDEEGVASFEITGDELHVAAQKEIQALAFIGGGPVGSGVVPWDSYGTTELEIIIPDAVVLTVRVVESAGGPADVHGTVHWGILVTTDHGGGMTSVMEQASGSCRIEGPSVTIPGFPDAAHLRLGLWEEDRLPVETELRIPAGVTEHEVVLTRGPRAPVLEIPLVDARGRPVISGSFGVYVRQPDAEWGETERSLEPSAEGVLVMPLGCENPGSVEITIQPREGALIQPTPVAPIQRPFRTAIVDVSAPKPLVLAVLAFPRVAPGTTHRLDPVVVPGTELLLAGQVLDAAGRPAPDVEVRMTKVEEPVPDAIRHFVVTTDSAGRFEVHATALPEELFLFGRRSPGFCPPVRVRVPDDVVRLTLLRPGVLEIDLRPPAELSRNEKLRRSFRTGACVALLVEENQLLPGWGAFFRGKAGMGFANTIGKWSVLGHLRSDQPLVFEDLVPAVYTVEVSVGLNRVLVVPGVRVEAGETTRDPRLRGFTVGEDLEPAVVRVRDPEGAPVAGARVRFQLPAWEATLPNGTNQETDTDGEAWFVVPEGVIVDLEVVAQRKAPVRLPRVSFPIEVVIGAGTALEVTIPNAAELRDIARAFTVSLTPYEGTPPTSPVQLIGDYEALSHPNAMFDLDAGRVTIPNLAPGHYRVWLATHGNPRTASRLPGHRTTFVHLGDYIVEPDSPPRLPAPHRLSAEQLAALRGL